MSGKDERPLKTFSDYWGLLKSKIYAYTRKKDLSEDETRHQILVAKFELSKIVREMDNVRNR